MNYKVRHVEQRLRLMAQHFKVILVIGARQTGKSTLLKHVFPDVPLITFDQYSDNYGAATDPELFVRTHPSPIILDEVQYVPGLMAVLKRTVDQSEAMGQYFLTGSHHIGLMKNASIEGMTGRIGIIDLEHMTPFEYESAFSFDGGMQVPPTWLEMYLQEPESLVKRFSRVADVYDPAQLLWRGGFPMALAQPAPLVSDYFASYLRMYLERDVAFAAPGAPSPLFNRFVAMMAASTAQEINQEKIMKLLGITRGTFLTWIELLIKTYQWRELLPYSGNLMRRVSQRGKGHFTDTGLAAYLQGVRDFETLSAHPASGALFESYCVNLIFAMMSGLYHRPAAYHWRTYAGAEVDLVLQMNGILYPIEFKFSTTISGHDARGIEAFRQAHMQAEQQGESVDRVGHGLIVYVGQRAYQLSERVTVIPFNALMRRA